MYTNRPRCRALTSARPLHLAQFTGDALWKKPETQKGGEFLDIRMASSSAKMSLGCFCQQMLRARQLESAMIHEIMKPSAFKGSMKSGRYLDGAET